MAADLGFHTLVAETKRADLAREIERAYRVAEARPDPIRRQRRGLLGFAAATVLSVALATGAAAHDGHDIAAAGNGGTSLAGASGGLILVGDITSGENAGGSIGVGDVSGGAVAIDGGTVATGTAVDAGAAGGVGLADASGGDENLAIAVE